jgi:D-aminopeptidase
VGETNDGGLNDIRARTITAEHVLLAIAGAQGGAVAEGCVGAGTGCEAFGFKGGIGTASRKLPPQFGGWTLGVLVQANYGGVLTIDGLPLGKKLQNHPFITKATNESKRPSADGSCMIIIATDAPLSAKDLRRLAARAVFGLARTGSSYSHGSGDYAIAFSTAPELLVPHGAKTTTNHGSHLTGDSLMPLFQAALEATEEAVYNALLRATTMTGSRRTVEALPLDKLIQSLKLRGDR